MRTTAAFTAAALLTLAVFFSGYYCPRGYAISYVYHTEKNGPVAGYGFCRMSTAPDMATLHQELIDGETELWESMGIEDNLKSLSILSINKL